MSEQKVEQLPSNYNDFVEKYQIKDLKKIASIDGIGYWASWKVVVTRRKKLKLYIYIVKENEPARRFVDIKGFPVEVLEEAVKYAQPIKEKIKELAQ